MDFELVSVIVSVLAVFILGLSKGGFAGIGMVSTPLLALVIHPGTAAAILLPILILQDAISLWAYRQHFDADTLKLLLPTGLAGVVAGSAMVGFVNVGLLSITLGIISILFGAERLWRLVTLPPQPLKFPAWVGAVSGIVAGFTSMIAHAGAPPFQFYVLPRRLGRDVYVGTSVIFFAAINLFKLPFFAALGQISSGTLLVSLYLLPVAVLSVMVGIRIVRRVSQEGFQMVASGLLVAIGVLLVVRPLLG